VHRPGEGARRLGVLLEVAKIMSGRWGASAETARSTTPYEKSPATLMSISGPRQVGLDSTK